ncbi:peptide-methionine (S)-S-oxide reductase MsrA [Geotalea sp. SG265]|uniref:peptide-methionine (S)-S-oxide reductase MsrA n=1 Tax=Geotalea sp. SG265 TaxID=2922867 RepID=UPI001FAF9D1A|nr:peptide-methionine (S)-S-oxide reductase MsrA [Geotalea sp. SG265]
MERLETATLAAGCFWCTEAVFQVLKGVYRVVSGYAGGNVENPTYQEVCSGRTKHAESVQISFDPQVISYGDLLDVFWRCHDPTTPNRQGADRGSQYRSAIFYHDDRQRRIAEESKEKAEVDGLWSDPIVTQIVPFTNFYPAEGYHQSYYRFNRTQPYCLMVIDPKIEKLRKTFHGWMKDDV